MSTSGNEDYNQRNTPVMEDSSSMTIEFLRARLLSERSISRAARQRADELTKRVAQLEKQLKTVILQRKKAEKATENVLAILENHGSIGDDASDDFDSGSDQGTDFPLCNDECKDDEYSMDINMEVRDINGETNSNSEVESSPHIGRNLSWRSGRESLHSLTQRKYMSSSRRSCSFASSASSSKLVGKSCRRIRHGKTISAVEETYGDSTAQTAKYDSGTTHTQDLNGLTDFGIESPRGGIQRCAENGELEFPSFQVLKSQTQADNSSSLNRHIHVGDKAMQKAIQHQAELIGQYEAEERAQREWEEKYREDSSFMLDSSRDLGSHSDMTEERDDMRAACHNQPPSSPKNIEHEMVGSRHSNEAQDDHSPSRSRHSNEAQDDFSPSPPPPVKMNCNKTNASGSSSPEFAFPSMLKVDNSLEQHASSSSNSRNPDNISEGKYELALVSNEANRNVKNVLGALEQAKLSLRGNLSSSFQQVQGDSLFRLPTDLRWNPTTSPRIIYSSPPLFRVAKRTPAEASSDVFYRSNFMETRNAEAWRPPMFNPFSNIPSFTGLLPKLSSPSGFSPTIPSTRFSPPDYLIRPHTYR
ncbi:unnamed protein product [Cuscuta europaea]|uniref:Uncharacterized protein n=1 Tax=Cuscuta europaea TaxID=41803 RepID=A0A9P0YKX2_CUSEU|nr:unnamed protein product [Cuscuta europaea]